LQDQLHPTSEGDRSGAVLKEFLDVRHLDARYVVGPGLSLVPCPAATRPELHVARGVEPFDFHFAPREMSDTR
jgi:hypothetical protein